WFEKLASLKSEQAYVSAFAGQFGEDKAVEALKDLGIDAKPYDSLVHQDNDLVGLDGTAYSVKSYASESDFMQVVGEHPDSANYVINADLYLKLEDSGNLGTLNDSGVSIINGGWDHSDAVATAQERLGAITGDINDELYDGIVDEIPFWAGIVLLCNLGADLSKYSNNRISQAGLMTNIAINSGKLATAGVGAATGGAIGAGIGSAIFPLVGTLIGAVIGTFTGAVIGELSHKDPASVGELAKSATGATVGRILGVLGKTGVAAVCWCILVVTPFV
ncbi:MAG TPA: DUF456 domain-containing protein, partial [Dehalococcoidia bacterium]|nr:DUF456 domain-containing protein [Dehalococcoidia bacterium]